MKFTLLQKLIISFFAVVMIIIAIISCKKVDSGPQEKSDDEILKKFFKIKAGTDPTVSAIAESIKRQNDKRHFVGRLTTTAGYPLWDKAKVSEKDEKKQVFIPFVPENGIQTKALLLVKLEGRDTLYHLMYGAA